MVVIRLLQGPMINTWESQSAVISVALMVVFVVGVVAWALQDGRADAAANPDPDRRQDLAMTWLNAGLIGGLIGGAVTWLISLFDKSLYAAGLLSELTTFAAFTALLVFVPAMTGVVVGRWLVDRNAGKLPQHHHGLAATAQDHAESDVFAAVGAGASGAAAAGAVGEATATAPPITAPPITEWPTAEIPATTDEPTTAEIPATTDEPTTAEIPTATDEPTTEITVASQDSGDSTD